MSLHHPLSGDMELGKENAMGIFRSIKFGSEPIRYRAEVDQRCCHFIRTGPGPNSEKFIVFGAAEQVVYLYTICRVRSFDIALQEALNEHVRLRYPGMPQPYVVGEDPTTTAPRVILRGYEYQEATALWTVLREETVAEVDFATWFQLPEVRKT